MNELKVFSSSEFGELGVMLIEDNMYIHMIEDNHESNAEQPLDRRLISGLREIREVIASASQLVDEMCAEVDRLQDERRRLNGNNCNDND